MEQQNYARVWFIAANNIKGHRFKIFVVVWKCNGIKRVCDSLFHRKSEKRTLPITDPEMTRFNISLNDGVEMVLWALQNGFEVKYLFRKFQLQNSGCRRGNWTKL